VGILLLIASRKFAVKENPLVEDLVEILPGTNCGACGFAGCRGLAEGFAGNLDLEAACPVGGDATADLIAEALGVERKVAEKKLARLRCGGTIDCAARTGSYEGIADCAAVHITSSSPKVCPFGCLGLGTCARACPFDAIEIVDGLMRIDEEKCVGCGVCAKVCPRQCIEMMGANQRIWVACQSEDTGAIVRKYCTVGCLGCGKCERNCPTGAIKVENFYSHIRPELCNGCGECARQCPTHAIVLRPPEEERSAAAAVGGADAVGAAVGVGGGDGT